MGVLKLSKPDENEEIDFESAYLTSLSTRQRFEMMFKYREAYGWNCGRTNEVAEAWDC
jgi:hypothetical protein